MNERIKELAKQAEWRFADQATDNFSEYDKRLEKFANLIIQECIDKIETYRIPVGNSAAGELACEWTYDALKEIRDDIKEHFEIKQ